MVRPMYLQPLHRAVLRENAVYRQNKKGFDFAIKGDIWFWFGPVYVCVVFSLNAWILEFSWSAEKSLPWPPPLTRCLSSRPGGERDAHQYSVQLCGAPGRRDGTKQQMRIW